MKLLLGIAIGLSIAPKLVAAQTAAAPRVELREGGRLLVSPGAFGTDASYWSLALPQSASAIHTVNEQLILIREAGRWRVMTGGPPGSGREAKMRTLPTHSARASFKGTSPDGEKLIFEAGGAREEIEIRNLLQDHLRTTVFGAGPPQHSSEPLATPVTLLFWHPARAPGYIGPGQGFRPDVIGAFSSRPAETIHEYEARRCEFPQHLAKPDRVWTWVPTQVRLFRHSLRDRGGATLTFYTALESGAETYLSEREAEIRGCEASYWRQRDNTQRSVDPRSELADKHYRFTVHLRDGGLPAPGVIVRMHFQRGLQEPSCGEQDAGSASGPRADALTLQDGSFVWDRQVSEIQDRRIRSGRRSSFDIRIDGSATLCVYTDKRWLPIWHENFVDGSRRVVCDLAAPSARRCREQR